MFSKIKIVFAVIIMCFCFSVFISCSSDKETSLKTEDEIIEAFDKGKISEEEFVKLMDALDGENSSASTLDSMFDFDLSDQYKDYM